MGAVRMLLIDMARNGWQWFAPVRNGMIVLDFICLLIRFWGLLGGLGGLGVLGFGAFPGIYLHFWT